MSTQKFESFEDFWPFYVREHSQPLTRTCILDTTKNTWGRSSMKGRRI